ncbi:MAG: hypothetical protein QXT34_03275 [Candidatus Aenigmatarchaeota archaeon]
MIVSSAIFLVLVIMSFLFLNYRFQEYRNINSEIFYRELLLSYFDRLIYSNPSVYKDLFINIFEINAIENGNQTIYINLSVSCEKKINVTSIRIYNSSFSELAFKIKDYDVCNDNSLYRANISVFLQDFFGKEILYVFMSSSYGNQVFYEFEENYKNASYEYIGTITLKGIDLYAFESIVNEYCKNKEEVEVEVFENENIIMSCKKSKAGNIFSFSMPILSINGKKLNIVLRIFE